MREREAKLVVSQDFRMPSTDRLAERIASATTQVVQQRAVYFDTPDLRLTRAGASLRFRSDDGWTVKLPHARTASSLVRDEHVFAGEPGTPPPTALRLVRAWARTRPLVEIATVDTRRQRTQLLDEGGEVIAELDDDDVTGRNSGDTVTRFREIEVELAPTTPDAFLQRVLRALRKAGAEPALPMSKVARVLGDAAHAPPDLPPAPALGADATVDELVRAAFVRSVGQLLAFDAVLRLTDDPEAVHKARVATRRLRSDLRTLRPVVDRGWSEPIRAELKWLGTVLGTVRDADVLLDALEQKVAALPDAERDVAAQLQRRLREARERDREILLEALDSNRYARLLDRLVAGSTQPRLRDVGVGKQRAADVVRPLVTKSGNRVRTQLRAIEREPADADLHETRKRAKQARYAHELAAPILGKSATRIADRFAAVQQTLGDHQDAVVASDWLLGAARDSSSREEAFVAGELAALFAIEKQHARDAWPAHRNHVRRAKLSS